MIAYPLQSTDNVNDVLELVRSQNNEPQAYLNYSSDSQRTWNLCDDSTNAAEISPVEKGARTELTAAKQMLFSNFALQ